MPLSALGSSIAGLLLVLLVQFAIVATVLHPEVESPLSTRLQRLTWQTLRAVDNVVPKRGNVSKVLNWALPLMVAGLIILWLMLLAVGFALVVAPWLGDPAVFLSPTPRSSTLVTALYYSGVTLATLGYGDVRPAAAPFRLLAVIEALMGALTIAFGVAHVLAVYPALSRTRTLAAALDAEVAGQAGALPMVRRYLGQPAGWSDDLTARLRVRLTGLRHLRHNRYA